MDSAFSTLIIIAITCLVSFLAFDKPRLMGSLIFWPPAVTRNHDYSRLITYGFVHANGQHLLFNMITLFFFGRAMEGFINARLGVCGFALFYLLALIASILPSYLRHRDDDQYRSLGASGAVSAVLFAYILIHPWSRIIVFVLPLPAIVYAALYLGYTIYMERRNADRTNHSAHLWGAAYGVVFMIVMDPRVIGYFIDQLEQPQFRT
ncbi:MAG TPA: rhomboid family intramembrane serine protease [Xanthomonadaceae bacterium]|jgi:membrane associated rhomboid family serine protease|nr:rhomboid family intramembrane serine protease [Xanthomonadaceae bacterium]